MRGLRYLLGIQRVDIMKEIMHIMVKQANNGNPSCEKGNRGYSSEQPFKQETILS